MRFRLLQWWFWSAATRVAHAFAPSMRRRLCKLRAARSAAEEQELLLTEPAVNAFIVAEVEAFVRERSYASEDQEAVTSDDVALITEATRAAYRAADAADVHGQRLSETAAERVRRGASDRGSQPEIECAKEFFVRQLSGGRLIRPSAKSAATCRGRREASPPRPPRRAGRRQPACQNL